MHCHLDRNHASKDTNCKCLVQKLLSKEIDGVQCEPFERVQIDTPEEYQGSVIQSLSDVRVKCWIWFATGNGQTVWSSLFLRVV